MNKKLIFIPLILSVLFIFSCRQQAATSDKNCLTEKEKQILIDDSLTDLMFGDTTIFEDGEKSAKKRYYGSIVKYKDVEPCLKLYEDSMKNHGIDTLPARDTSMRISRTFQSTRAEYFRGREVKKFIRAAARKRGQLINNHKNLEIRIVPGIYTREFVGNNDITRIGRIGMFLVTRRYKKVSENKWVLDDDPYDEDAFDFGGIEP